jgi:hypothetical protein
MYRIRVHGRLDQEWSERLQGMAISTARSGNEFITEFTGQLPDQAALMGILGQLYNSRVPLLRVDCLSLGDDDR